MAKREPGGQPPPRIGLRATLVLNQLRRMIDTVAVEAEGNVNYRPPLAG